MHVPSGLTELREALDRGELSSQGLIERAFERIDRYGSRLGIFVDLRRSQAFEEATQADERRSNRRLKSCLDGIPFAVKDNIAVKDEPLGCASRILQGYRSPFSATALLRLKEAGAILIGRTNMDEFAMGSSTEHSIHGATRNPWNSSCTPGGSSGGSAAAVAADIVPFSLGSDTGGSIRQPAAFCGVVGFKPTYGRVSRWGLVAFGSSLDQIGPFARSAEDCGQVLGVISGHDIRDSSSLHEPAVNCCGLLSRDVTDIVIGLPREYFETIAAGPGVADRCRQALGVLESAGATLREVSLPHAKHALTTYHLIAAAEASSNLARFDGVRYGKRALDEQSLFGMYEATRSQGFGTEVKRRILVGTYVLSAGYHDSHYRKAQQVRTLLRQDYDNAFDTCDVIALPTTPETAFPLGEKETSLEMSQSDVFTVLANLVGAPGISVPCGFDAGLPVGVQFLGKPLDDITPLRVADTYQHFTNYHQLCPQELV